MLRVERNLLVSALLFLVDRIDWSIQSITTKNIFHLINNKNGPSKSPLKWSPWTRPSRPLHLTDLSRSPFLRRIVDGTKEAVFQFSHLLVWSGRHRAGCCLPLSWKLYKLRCHNLGQFWECRSGGTEGPGPRTATWRCLVVLCHGHYGMSMWSPLERG